MCLLVFMKYELYLHVLKFIFYKLECLFFFVFCLGHVCDILNKDDMADDVGINQTAERSVVWRQYQLV